MLYVFPRHEKKPHEVQLLAQVRFIIAGSVLFLRASYTRAAFIPSLPCAFHATSAPGVERREKNYFTRPRFCAARLMAFFVRTLPSAWSFVNFIVAFSGTAGTGVD